MKIAVINEVSASSKNEDIIKALDKFDHSVINVGMKNPDEGHQLTYIHTGFLTALFLQTKTVDFVIGGCGTGQGYLNSAMQYPNVFCGLIVEPLDGWLFSQINGGNCISLALNKGYGWAGNENLNFIFERLFSAEIGCGYPAHRKESQKQSRDTLNKLSAEFHLSFDKIIDVMDDDMFKQAVTYPGVLEHLKADELADGAIKTTLLNKLNKLNIKY